VLSLVVCLASVWIWVRSYRVIDIVYWKFGTNDLWHAQTNGGVIYVERVADYPGPAVHWWLTIPLPPDETGDLHYPGTGLPLALVRSVPRKRLGIKLYEWVDADGRRATASVTSIWMPAAAAGALPLVRFVAWVARALVSWSRRRRGRCAKCGYDMRGTPERCPECGNAASRASRGR
jgi:hypothetical protein